MLTEQEAQASSSSISSDQVVQPQQLNDLWRGNRITARKARSEILPTGVQKHESLYFSNGDIALLSLPNQNGVVTAFKVDRVFLLRASPVFEGMLQLPLNENAETFDDAPLVRLQDESEHLAMFLNALYDSRYCPFIVH